MKISIELFLLDNFIMNYLLFSLASVLSGTHMRMGYTALSAGIGAGYALAGLAWLPVLQWLPVKGLAFGLLALPLRAKGQKYIYLLLSVFLAAFLLSGTLLFLTGLFGGSVGRNGTLVGAVPLRVALLGAGLCATLPRLFRKLFAAHHLKAFTAQITIEWGGQSMTCTALLDSGNALTEPLSGLPVILVAGPLPAGPRRPIPYQTQGGTGLLQGARPDRVLLMDTHEVNAWVCAAPQPIQGADAIFPSCLVPNEWRGMRNEGLGMRNFSASLRGARMRRVSGETRRSNPAPQETSKMHSSPLTPNYSFEKQRRLL